MKKTEIIGSISSLLLCVVLAFNLSGNVPAYRYWVPHEIVEASPPAVGQGLSNQLWNQFYPALLILVFIMFTLAIAAAALLRRE